MVGRGAMTNSIEELAGSKLLLVTGSNTTETHPVISLRMKKAVKNGAKLIVVDPRKIELTKWADKYIQIRICLLYTSPSPRDRTRSRMPSSA